MTGSLGMRASAFEGLTLRNVFALLAALESSTLRTSSRMRTVFSEHSQGFEATLSFLVAISVVQVRTGLLSICMPVPSPDGQERREWLLSLLLETDTKYRSEMLAYVRRYRVQDGELVYDAPAYRRPRESYVRNFLMEMGVVRQGGQSGRYVLSRDYVSLCAAAAGRRGIRPEMVLRSVAERDELGLMAEKAVVKYEKERLGGKHAGEVDHVATRNAAAGYDIRSITIEEGNRILPRYIEVKAVSPLSTRFFWTPNEISVARVLGRSYYLYLVLVTAGPVLDLANLMVVSDPWTSILGASSEWLIEPDVITCSLPRERRPVRYLAGDRDHA